MSRLPLVFTRSDGRRGGALVRSSPKSEGWTGRIRPLDGRTSALRPTALMSSAWLRTRTARQGRIRRTLAAQSRAVAVPRTRAGLLLSPPPFPGLGNAAVFVMVQTAARATRRSRRELRHDGRGRSAPGRHHVFPVHTGAPRIAAGRPRPCAADRGSRAKSYSSLVTYL